MVIVARWALVRVWYCVVVVGFVSETGVVSFRWFVSMWEVGSGVCVGSYWAWCGLLGTLERGVSSVSCGRAGLDGRGLFCRKSA